MVSPSEEPILSNEHAPAKTLEHGEVGRSPLRLSVTRGELGLELYEPQSLGPLEVRHLATSLKGLRFPVDLSGGVPQFRHRRGQLQTMELRCARRPLAAWLSPRLRGVLGSLDRPIDLAFGKEGVRIGLVADCRALTFEVLWVPDGDQARWLVAEARGVGLQGAALGYALRAADGIFRGIARRSGRVLRAPTAAAHICKALLPPLGARVPDCGEARFCAVELLGEELLVRLDAEERVASLEPGVIAALQLAELTEAGDDALAAGRADEARAEYLRALEAAPRHPELSLLVSEIDAHHGGRDESALAMLSEATLAVRAGWVGARLLASQGDLDGAREAFSEAAAREPYAPLAALLWLEVHSLPIDAHWRAQALDAAVAACPGLRRVRWSRFSWRVRRGDAKGASSDAQHLEASVRGASAKHAVCMEVGRELLTCGLLQEARGAFERALRYLPDDVEATSGLARSYREAGDPQRALYLYQRAARLDDERATHEPALHLEFAELLATAARDLPQAIARVRTVPDGTHYALRARALEGRWRAQLGDIAGASLAYARLRESAELSPGAHEELASWLHEASRFESEVQRDLVAAERHLAAAVRISPRDARVLEAYRRAAAAIAARGRAEPHGGEGPAGG